MNLSVDHKQDLYAKKNARLLKLLKVMAWLRHRVGIELFSPAPSKIMNVCVSIMRHEFFAYIDR